MSNLLHDILEQAGSNKRKQRLGRGEASKGKTSGRGHKGAGSRAGKPKRIGFEGGQTEIYRRFPRRGFSNAPFETRYHAVNIQALERFDEGATVDITALKQAGLIPNTRLGVKILGQGQLGKKLTVIASAYSRSAHKAITDSGGEAQNENGQPFEFRPPVNRRQASKLERRLQRLGLAEPPAPEEASEAPAEGGKKAKGSKGGKEGKKPKEAGEGKPRARRSAAPAADPSGKDDAVTEAPESGEHQPEA